MNTKRFLNWVSCGHTTSIKTSLGWIDIIDNLYNPKKGKAVVIKIRPYQEVDIEGGPRIIVLKKEN